MSIVATPCCTNKSVHDDVRLVCRQILGDGMEKQQRGLVVSVSEQTSLASVTLQPPTSADYEPPRYSDTVHVPVTRLRTVRNEVTAALLQRSISSLSAAAVWTECYKYSCTCAFALSLDSGVTVALL